MTVPVYIYILGGFDGLDCPEAYDIYRMLVKGDCLVYESGGLMISKTRPNKWSL